MSSRISELRLLKLDIFREIDETIYKVAKGCRGQVLTVYPLRVFRWMVGARSRHEALQHPELSAALLNLIHYRIRQYVAGGLATFLGYRRQGRPFYLIFVKEFVKAFEEGRLPEP